MPKIHNPEKTTMTYYVIGDQDNLTSWSAKLDAAENFKTRRAARKRADELARCEPGLAFHIAQVITTVRCPVGEPEASDAR